MNFGERLKKIRIERNLHQEDIGKMVHVGKSTVSQWESGIHAPDLETVAKLANLLNVSADYLLGRTDERSLPVVGPTDDLATTARRLKAIRDSRAMSQRELADRLGISVPELARYESAIAAPPDELVDKLAEVFEVDRRYFTGEIPQEEIERLLGETWFRAPAELSPEERQSIEDYIAFVIARRQKKQGM